MANIIERGRRFSHLLGLELKGAISAQGFTVRQVSAAIGVHHTTMSNYFNGSRALPADTLNEACEHIGVEPAELVDRAYDRLVKEFGEYATMLSLVPEPEIVSVSESIMERQDDYEPAAYDPGVDIEAEQEGMMEEP